ncbi:hypothetical protein BGZ61DRAFT_483552 [Ilyonectria robusta]|uniref:uncharacterized protein n=1 Tax=Ilyonectria robusta TaxID=1079257 RepID=UPI001E8E208D|nr:uncharacterized protein BGZ61DRAFT_483552 [Ilyonectria robusta]KAH8669394.1 hypothetical protein BGZ61DRAFT_483552 [Ilyonectria robusta]
MWPLTLRVACDTASISAAGEIGNLNPKPSCRLPHTSSPTPQRVTALGNTDGHLSNTSWDKPPRASLLRDGTALGLRDFISIYIIRKLRMSASGLMDACTVGGFASPVGAQDIPDGPPSVTPKGLSWIQTVPSRRQFAHPSPAAVDAWGRFVETDRPRCRSGDSDALSQGLAAPPRHRDSGEDSAIAKSIQDWPHLAVLEVVKRSFFAGTGGCLEFYQAISNYTAFDK